MSIEGDSETYSNTYTFGDRFLIDTPPSPLGDGPRVKAVPADQPAWNANETLSGKRLSPVNCAGPAVWSKAWFDAAFTANPGFFRPGEAAIG